MHHAVVIGGGSGIGAAVARRYRDDGVPVSVWDVTGERDVTCDVSDPASIEAAVAGMTTLPTEVTITAGVGHSGLLADAGADEWDRIMAVNARGPWLCMRGLAKAMQAAGQSGSIIATSSVSAHLVDRSMGLYCASKAALSMLVQVAAAEWGHSSIRVNGIGPGITDTPMLGAPADAPWFRAAAARTTLGRLGSADDIAQAIRGLHQMAWVTGQILDCDGGLSLHSPIDVYGEIEQLRQGERP
jgi:NAD(P)-dependent dehydrogenase (short-subunit alcohol dehydrogenase family)